MCLVLIHYNVFKPGMIYDKVRSALPFEDVILSIRTPVVM